MKHRRIPSLVLSLFAVCILISGCGSSNSNTQPLNGAPTLSSLSTDNVLVGSSDLTLNISGSGFVSGASVSFGSNTLTPTSVTASQLSVVVPQNLLTTAVIMSVAVTNPAPGGGVSNALQFTVKNQVPTVESLSVNSAVIGSPDLTVSLTGKGFAPGAKVSFGSTDLTPATATDTQLSFVIPEVLLSSTGVIPVTASNPEPGGGVSNALSFTVGNPLPTLTSFVSSSTLINNTGFTLEIDGTGFVAGTQVLFGSDTLTPASVTSTHIAVGVPDALLKTARMVPVSIVNPEPIGGTSNAIEFGVYNPVPQITSLSTSSVEAGAQQDLALSLTGTKFVAGATVSFGPQQLTPTSTSDGTIEVVIPVASLTSGVQTTITVSNPGPGGGASNAMEFTVTNPVPELTALSQLEATAGDPSFDLALMGAKFVPTTTVTFAGVSLTPSSVSGNQLIVNIPESAFATGGVIQVSVANPAPGGGVSSSIDFTINNPLPSISAVLPTSITNTGSDATITLSGANFVSTSKVKVGANEVSASQTSKTSMQVIVPAAMIADGVASGSIALTVNNPEPSGGTSNVFNLIVHDKAALVWRPLANTSTTVPGLTVPFSIFGSPSVNSSGTVVFTGTSALSTSGSGETSSTLGVYSVAPSNLAITKIADTATLVPDPNTLTYGNSLAKFGGFPSFASIDQDSPLVAFAATHPPVLQFASSGKAGNAGLYANPSDILVTGVGLFTQAPYTYFQVPDMPAGTAFNGLPVSPAVVNGSTLVFKGDYLNGTTVAMGVYYRDLTATNGSSEVQLIASTVSTLIPGQGVKFGYIAAPSAESGKVVFVGYNRSDNPAAGGIYSAPVAQAPALTQLVKIGDAVPGESATFTRFGDAVSFDGRYVGFWGAWGTENTTRHLTCPTDGDPALDAYCLTIFPSGFDAQVPVHQGIFVYDTIANSLTAIAKTGNGFSDFTYWPFVGTVPEEAPTGTGSGEVEVPVEVPAFVLSPHVVVTGSASSSYMVAFEASTGPVDGIYSGSESNPGAIVTVVDTTMPATTLDLNANSTTRIKKLDMEREGLRGNWLTIGSTMVDSATQAGSSGIYAADTSPNR